MDFKPGDKVAVNAKGTHAYSQTKQGSKGIVIGTTDIYAKVKFHYISNPEVGAKGTYFINKSHLTLLANANDEDKNTSKEKEKPSFVIVTNRYSSDFKNNLNRYLKKGYIIVDKPIHFPSDTYGAYLELQQKPKELSCQK